MHPQPDEPALSVDFALPASPLSGSQDSTRRRNRGKSRRDWRAGGRSVRAWGTKTLTTSLLAVGLGLLAAAAMRVLLVSGDTLTISAPLWLGMVVVAAVAVSRTRPRLLFRLRPYDFLAGLAIGLALRVFLGWFGGVNADAFPSATGLGEGPMTWLSSVVLPAAIIGPLLEEFVFRGVVMVAVYSASRPRVGTGLASVFSVVISSIAFVALHGVTAPLGIDDAQQLLILSLACSAAVFATGRIWTAVFIHATYNISYLLVTAVGTMLR